MPEIFFLQKYGVQLVPSLSENKKFSAGSLEILHIKAATISFIVFYCIVCCFILNSMVYNKGHGANLIKVSII